MILIREIDLSTAGRSDSSASLFVLSTKGPTKLRVVGEWPLAKFYRMSMKRKIAFRRDFKSGVWQQSEMSRIFGQPCNRSHPITFDEINPSQTLNVVRAE